MSSDFFFGLSSVCVAPRPEGAEGPLREGGHGGPGRAGGCYIIVMIHIMITTTIVIIISSHIISIVILNTKNA